MCLLECRRTVYAAYVARVPHKLDALEVAMALIGLHVTLLINQLVN